LKTPQHAAGDDLQEFRGVAVSVLAESMTETDPAIETPAGVSCL
jgi:hypothetical protein